MFLSKMHKGIKLNGFIEKSMFFGAEYVKARHDLLASYLSGHSTPLYLDPRLIEKYPLLVPTMEHVKVSLSDLLGRCEYCSQKHGIQS